MTRWDIRIDTVPEGPPAIVVSSISMMTARRFVVSPAPRTRRDPGIDPGRARHRNDTDDEPGTLRV